MTTRRERSQQNPTPERDAAIWEKAFFKVMRETGNVSEACKAARINRSTAYEKRESDSAFKELWEDARREAADWLEKEAWRRAVKGVKQPVYQQGLLVGHKQVYSDQLLARLLEANNPEKFRRHTDFTSGGEKVPIVVIKMDMDEL